MEIPKNSDGKNWMKDLTTIVAVFIVLYLGLAAMRPLAGPDEGRYSEIPREMVEGGDWVTPRLNGMPYFYKPPMFYWLQAASIKAFGINKISLRAPNSLMAIFGIALTYCTARALYGRRTGILSAAVLGTSLFYFVIGEIVVLDMTVSVFIAASMFSFIVALKRSGVWRGVLILAFFASCALAVMTKGLMGIFIPCAVIFIYAFCVGIFDFLKSFKKSDILWILGGILLFSAIALPWHILAAAANPAFENAEGIFSKKWDGQGFFWYYIIHEHVLRFVDAETSMREQPFWFFFVLAPIGMIPWITALPQALSDAFKGGLKASRKKSPEVMFFFIWVCFVVLFFSISKSKLLPYIIPIYPALAIIVGRYAARVWENPENFNLKFIKISFIAMGILGAIAAPILFFVVKSKYWAFDPVREGFIFGAMFIFMLASFIALCNFSKNGMEKKFMTTSFLAIFGFLMFFNPLATYFQRTGSEGIVERLNELNVSASNVVVAYDYGSFQDLPVLLNSLTFHLGGPPEEQKFGYMREEKIHAERFLKTREEFLKFAESRKGDVFVAIHEKNLNYFNEIKIPYATELKTGKLMLLKILK